MGDRVLAVDHFPLPYIPERDHINSVFDTSELYKMGDIALGSFGHTLVFKGDYFFKITVLIRMNNNSSLFPGVADSVENLSSPDKGGQFVLSVYRGIHNRQN